MRNVLTTDDLQEKSVNEFSDSGLLWYINIIMHAFGWCIFRAIIKDHDGDEIKVLLPARTKYRGFPEQSNDKGYRRLAEYLVENADSIYADCMEDE